VWVPDFEVLISTLEKLRVEIERDYDIYFARLLPAVGNQVDKDVRLTAFAHLGGLVDSTLLAFTFIDRHLLPLDNIWWEEVYKPPFQPFDDYWRSVNINRLNNSFIKQGFLIKLFSEVESTFRILLREIDPLAANKGTASFPSIYQSLKKKLGSFPTDADDLLNLLRLSRNTVHNNGLYFHDSRPHDQITYKGATYNFDFGKPIDFVNWEWLFERFEDVRKLFNAAISNSMVLDVPTLIADPFAANRKIVPR